MSLDNDAVEIDVQFEAEEVEIQAEVQDVVVTLMANVGPPGQDGAAGGEDALLAHIDSELPHPIYDDGASFFLLYENAKV